MATNHKTVLSRLKLFGVLVISLFFVAACVQKEDWVEILIFYASEGR